MEFHYIITTDTDKTKKHCQRINNTMDDYCTGDCVLARVEPEMGGEKEKRSNLPTTSATIRVILTKAKQKKVLVVWERK